MRPSVLNPKRITYFWHAGVGHNADDEQTLIRKLENQAFDLGIFLAGDFTLMPNAVVSVLVGRYVQVDSGDLTVFAAGPLQPPLPRASLPFAEARLLSASESSRIQEPEGRTTCVLDTV